MNNLDGQPAFRDLEGKVIIVTGGTRGIGRAIVLCLARQGSKVVFTYHNRANDAEELIGEIGANVHQVVALQSDVRDLQQGQAVVKMTLERFGRLDGLVNNAGITRDKALMLMEAGDWGDVIDTNLGGAYNLCRASIVTLMKQRFGRIVNISSIAGCIGLPRQANYSASKAGLIGLTKSLAKELAPFGITVNAIAPGYIETEMTEAIGEKQKAEVIKKIPLGRFGRPNEGATIVSMLLSDVGAYITGQVVVVDGGLAS